MKKIGLIRLSSDCFYDENAMKIVYSSHKKERILTESEHKFLKYLIDNEGTVCSFDSILNYIWDENYIPNSPNDVLYKIKNALLKDIPALKLLIASRKGVGYIFERDEKPDNFLISPISRIEKISPYVDKMFGNELEKLGKEIDKARLDMEKYRDQEILYDHFHKALIEATNAYKSVEKEYKKYLMRYDDGKYNLIIGERRYGYKVPRPKIIKEKPTQVFLM